MDGIYSRGRLCFILSQFDRDFDAKYYVENNQGLKESLHQLEEDLDVQNQIQKSRQRQLRESQKNRRNYKASIGTLEAQMGERKAAPGKNSRTSTRSQLKRKRSAGDAPSGKY